MEGGSDAGVTGASVVAERKSAAPSRSEGECAYIRFHYSNRDPLSLRATEETSNPCGGVGGWEPDPHACLDVFDDSLAFAGTDLLPWNEYSLDLHVVPFSDRDATEPFSGREYVSFVDPHRAGSAMSPWPRPSGLYSTARASADRRAVTWQPAHLAFDAEVCDTLMFMAQMCLDRTRLLVRVRERESSRWIVEAVEAANAGREFASYALSIIASRAKLSVHEIGHIYLGGSPHCGFDASILTDREREREAVYGASGSPRWRSCFDVASHAFEVHVRAENGLPADSYCALRAGSARILRADSSPDFDVRLVNERTFEVDRPFWAGSFDSFTSCGNVRQGLEYQPTVALYPEDGWVVSTATVCVGKGQWSLTDIGKSGGGYTFQTTNGCDCAVASVPTTLTGGSVIDGYAPGSSVAPCPGTIAFARGMVSVDRT